MYLILSSPDLHPGDQKIPIRNFMGHKFRVVTIKYFPTIDHEPEGDAQDTRVRLKDSLNTRMLGSIALHLNFT